MFVTHGNGLLISAIFWGAIVLIVFANNFFGYRERSSRHRMIETLAEKGQPIPPEMINTRSDLYYPETLRLLSVLAIQERFPACL